MRTTPPTAMGRCPIRAPSPAMQSILGRRFVGAPAAFRSERRWLASSPNIAAAAPTWTPHRLASLRFSLGPIAGTTSEVLGPIRIRGHSLCPRRNLGGGQLGTPRGLPWIARRRLLDRFTRAPARRQKSPTPSRSSLRHDSPVGRRVSPPTRQVAHLRIRENSRVGRRHLASRRPGAPPRPPRPSRRLLTGEALESTPLRIS
jgi:hypothetical protein